MGTPLEPQSLIKSILAGDGESFRLLYGTLSPRVFRFIRPRARSREDALDVLQETFIDFWKGLPNFVYVGDASLYAYLYRIASRKLSRSYLLERHVSLESMEDFIFEGEETEVGVAQDVMAALSLLKGSDRDILTLRHFEGLSFSEISQLLEENENTLKVRHHRAIARLRQKLNYE